MDVSNFQRRDNASVFQLSSNASTTRAIRRGAAAQFFSQLSPTVFNEFQTGYMYNPIGGGPGNALMPLVQVTVGNRTLTAGPGVGNQGGDRRLGRAERLLFASPTHTLASARTSNSSATTSTG
jgi:hypothetical protein